MKSTGVLKKDRPKAPPRDPKYPTQQDVALSLLKQFAYNFPEIHVQCILADALYGDKKFMAQASTCFTGVQVHKSDDSHKRTGKIHCDLFQKQSGCKKAPSSSGELKSWKVEG